MADKRVSAMSHHGVVSWEVHMEYDETDFREINDDGDPDDFRVIRWYGTNFSVWDLTVVAKRGNGQAWMERVIPAGSTFSQNAGGPVKYQKDIPVWSYS